MAISTESMVLFLVFIVLILLSYAVRLVKAYERAVVFRRGTLQGVKGPGLILLIPLVDRVFLVDVRPMVLEVSVREVARDRVPLKVHAVVQLRVTDPEKIMTQEQNFIAAAQQISEKALRDFVSEMRSDHVLAGGDDVNTTLQETIDRATRAFGVEVLNVETKAEIRNENRKR